MTSSTAHFLLSTLLGQWHEQLTDWASSGRLTSAAQESLLLSGEPQALKQLVAQLVDGDYKEIPEISLLPATAMNGAMAAYSAETGNIFLNTDWLQNTTKEQVLLVLTEELGHHLDAILNQTDTLGDEGELLARLLDGEKLSVGQIALIESDHDQAQLSIGGQILQVEQAALAKVSVTAFANGNESDGSPVVFNFQRSGVTSSPLSVNYRLYGTAKANSDYSGATTGTVNFAAGSSSATLSLPALADFVIDPGETIIAQINPSSSYAITPGQQTATATITAEGVVVNVKAGQLLGSTSECSNVSAFAALKSDGSVVAWGDNFSGGTTPFGLTGVTQIYSGNGAFAALKSDGSVVAWGDSSYGGIAPVGLRDVTQIFSNANAFVALKSDGKVVAWGKSDAGGMAPAELSQVNQISSSGAAFAALKNDGSVVSWGDIRCGGISPLGLSGVNHIFSNPLAFAAVKIDGTVVAWGDSLYGGTAPPGLSGVTEISSTLSAFAALKSDGSVVAWGDSELGATIPPGLTDVTKIYSNYGAFTALKSDGSIISWGNDVSGGTAPSVVGSVTQVFNTFLAFAALRSDGSVVCWGKSDYGGIAPTGLTGVMQIYPNAFAFAALKSDGSVVAWGDSAKGGSAPAGLSGVTQIFSSGGAFAALKSDGSVVAWGDSSYGGTAPAGLTDVVGFANPLTDDHLLLKPITNWISVDSTANGNEADGSPVVFRFSRTGNTSEPLTVSYRLFGTAQAGLDYTGISTGSITFQAGSSTAQLALPALADGALIDPGETVIARIDTSTLYGITPGQQIATATITAEKVVVSVKDPSSWSGEPLNAGAFAAIKSDGSVVAWGTSRFGGTAPSGLTGVSQIYSNSSIFAALRSDGTVVDWGNKSEFYDASLPTGLTDVTQIFPNLAAFAALKNDGSVVAWGASYWGGRAPANLTEVKTIYSTDYSFAALKSDGSVVAWGILGDSIPSGLKDVIAISATRYAFAALKSDGTVVAWGSDSIVPPGLSGVTKIYSSGGAFAALKNDGTVVAWGKYTNGGMAPYGLSGITQIYSNEYAFAALTADGSVVAWGEGIYGGSAPTGLTGIAQIFSTQRAFAAIKTDGSVVAWGDQYSGGRVPQGLNNVTQIFSNDHAFAAIKKDGTVVAWGEYSYGGLAPSGLTGVTQIYSSDSSFAALKSDGSVEAWGGNGGNEPTGLTGVVAFANPFTNDRLILDNTPPIITLEVAPSAGVTEDGSANLVYTFHRSGPTTSALTVNYTVGGTATLGTDYTGIAATPATKTAIFAAHSSTAIVTVDPTTDTTIEADETVALTLAVGTGYTVGTTDAVVGTILNFVPYTPGYSPGYATINDLNLGTTPSGYALKSGTTAPIQITFSGQFASAANPGVGWRAIAAAANGSDYDLYWRNTTSSQFARWTLNSSGALSGGAALTNQEISTTETALNFDLNQDSITGFPYTPGSATINGLNLGSTDFGYALRSGTNAPIQITFSEQFASASNPGVGWSAIAAAANGSGYDLYWRNSNSSQFGRWTLNSSGALSGAGLISTQELLTAETALNYDINQDSITGFAYTPGSATINGLNLGNNETGYALRSGTAAPIQITFAGQFASASNPGDGWSAIAAAANGSGYDLYWRNSNSSQFGRWTLNSSGALSSAGLISTQELLTAETTLSFDLSGNGIGLL